MLRLVGADKILLYMVNNGIAGYRLSARGFGGSHPIVSNDNEELRQLNRRVEFKVIRVK
ncbi:MAG: outer membrane protein OmpA-like peptidoglycan-associated protein [Arenicella sp.]|jgi:outer membrane protein OmpA-like peptidoglycan-associated protein